MKAELYIDSLKTFTDVKSKIIFPYKQIIVKILTLFIICKDTKFVSYKQQWTFYDLK